MIFLQKEKGIDQKNGVDWTISWRNDLDWKAEFSQKFLCLPLKRELNFAIKILEANRFILTGHEMVKI